MFGTITPETPARFPKITKLADAPFTMPAILNIVTAAQPGIDKFNRTAFDVLGAHVPRHLRHALLRDPLHPAPHDGHHVRERRQRRQVLQPGRLPQVHATTPQKYILLELAGKMVRNDEWPICASRRPKTGRPAAPPAARRAPAPPKTRCTTHEPEP